MSKRILCKFFASEGCLKGENCHFSHDWKAPTIGICNLYQKGVCPYGRRCKYQHVKISQSQPSESSTFTERKWAPVEHRSGIAINSSNVAEAEVKEHLSSNRPVIPSIAPANREISGNREKKKSKMSVNHADKVLCSFPTIGDCPSGYKCPHVHGDLCPTCEKHCLHPFRPKEREEHMESCRKLKRRLETIRLSKDIECNVCLERVLLKKPTPAERKFGILPECDHPFCVSCIRNWRRISAESGVDVNSAVRACPTCRKVSYFVVPSSTWYSSEEEKQEIISSYKEKLSSIDCKHFKFGNGTCPFGSSCFYKHMVKPGSSFWNQTLNPGAHSSRYPNRHRNRYHQDSDEEYESDSDGIPDMDLESWFWKASRNPDMYDVSDMVLEAMFWEASRNPDMYGPLSEDMDGIGPIENPDIPSFQLLFNHLYHPRVSMDEEHDHDSEEETTEDLDDMMANFRMLSMLQAGMVNGSSDDE